MPIYSNRSWTWKLMRGLVITLAVVATSILLFYALENWRGKKAWEAFKQTWEAKGERFDLAAFIPKSVPDEQNFAMTPFFAGLLDYHYDRETKRAIWKDTNAFSRAFSVSITRGESGQNRSPDLPDRGNRERGTFTDLQAWQKYYQKNTNYPSPPNPGQAATDVLYALKYFEPVLAEMETASHRPYAMFPIHYHEGHLALLPYLSSIKSLAQVLHLRSVAFLQLDRADRAAADVKLSLHLAASVKTEPFLVSQMVRMVIIQKALDTIWEGLCQGQWPEAHLKELQQWTGSLNVLEDYGRAERGERGLSNEVIEKQRQGQLNFNLLAGEITAEYGNLWPESWVARFYPSGWYYQNQLLINRLHQEHTLPLINSVERRVFPNLAQTMDRLPELQKRTPYNVLAVLLFPAAAQSAVKFAHTQSLLALATTALALERYRLAQGKYPETLGALAAGFLEKVPDDVVNGQPLRYVQAGNHFKLYSLGWNLKDDGGHTGERSNRGEDAGKRSGKENRPDLLEGDWVWSCPK